MSQIAKTLADCDVGGQIAGFFDGGRSIRARVRPGRRTAIPAEHRSRGRTGKAGPGIARAVVTPDTTNGLTPQRRRPTGLNGCGCRASIKTQVPCCPARHEGDTCCRRTIRSEIRAAHRVRLRTIPASAEDSRGSGAPANYHPKATRKLHREEDMCRAVTDCADVDAVKFDGHRDIARPCVRRGHIF